MADAAEKYEYEDERQRFRIVGTLPWKGCTYKDYLSWGEDVRCELIDGIPHMMAGVTLWHQRMAGGIYRQLADFLEGKTCQAIIAPFDVRLFPEDDDLDKTILQPDVLVVCDEKKLRDNKSCKGPPDFVAEVLSPSTRGKDLIDKKELYQNAGVREYWVVDTDKVYKYLLTDGVYTEEIISLDSSNEIPIEILEGCLINFSTG